MSGKYEFDRVGMEFRKVSHSVWGILGKIVKYFLATPSLAVVYYLAFSLVVSTDSERKLRRENQMYERMYGEMSRKQELIGDVISGLRGRDNSIYRQLFDAEAPDFSSISPESILSAVDTIPDRDIVAYTARKLDVLRNAESRVERNFTEIRRKVESGDRDSLPPLHIPLGSFSYARTGASVGQKINPFYKVPVLHEGLDMIVQKGEPVFAAADGRVADVTHSRKGLGNVVTIDHGNGYTTRYAHLENTLVVRGQKVSQGSRIGQVGMSGNSFAPHLHYEVLKDTARLDPVHFFFASLTPDEYIGMMFMSANTGQSMD